jgi:hypothetical protein
MGVSPTGGLNVSIDYRATYGLLMLPARAATASGVRYDKFEVEDKDANCIEDNNTDDGEA